MKRDARDLTKRMIDERDREEQSAHRGEEEAARAAAAAKASREADLAGAFSSLRSLVPFLLEHHQSEAELVTISHWKPQPAWMRKLFGKRPEEIAAWELARGFRGPYHPYHDMPIDCYDACRVMLTGDGRILFGAARADGDREFTKPSQYTVITNLDERLRARLGDCGLGSASAVRRRIKVIENGGHGVWVRELGG